MTSIVLNGERIDAPTGATVATLIASLGHDGRGIAVAINEAVVPRALWSATAVAAGDAVEVLTAAQGG